MEETPNTPPPAGDWRKAIDDLTVHTEQLVREDPAKAVGIALFSGVLLTILPVGRLVAALVRLAFALARPALLIFGVVKIYEELQKERQK